MSCRHSLANGTCCVCYPDTGTLHPVGPGDSLDGPGAVDDDPGFLRPAHPIDAPSQGVQPSICNRPMDALLDALILLSKTEGDTRTPLFKIMIASEPSGWCIENKAACVNLGSAMDDLTQQVNRFIDQKLDEVHKRQEEAYNRYSKAREESSRLEQLVGESRKP